ncbi:MAG: guanylate kinase [Chitinophagaceae bacterium]|nr:guanylate kinase [Chitinophagaceae bacterium]
MNSQRGKIIILTAPSGAGKTSITRYLLSKFPKLSFSISATTRPLRGDEKNGKDYYFLSEEEFHENIRKHAFVEWEMVYQGKYYGTLQSELERIWDEEKTPVLDIDVKGAIHVQEQYDRQSLSLFIQPPSVDELQRRLRQRGTETEESIQARVSKAAYEMSFKHHFNKVIINHDLEKACAEAEAAVKEFLGWDSPHRHIGT